MIVGFPGESEADFQQTIDFCRRIGFMKLHVFPFSSRQGTPAAEMPDQLSESVKEDRVRRLIAVGNEMSLAYRQRLLGTMQPVLLEEPSDDGRMSGYTPQYVSVVCDGGAQGTIVQVHLTDLTPEGMSGVRVEP